MIQNQIELQQLIKDTMKDWFGLPHVSLADRFRRGTLILQPANRDLQPKEVDIETFFHKIVMVRESLRVLEQKINNHEKLDDADRIQLQNYIARIHGSLTTFNVLFQDEDERFTGQKY